MAFKGNMQVGDAMLVLSPVPVIDPTTLRYPYLLIGIVISGKKFSDNLAVCGLQ